MSIPNVTPEIAQLWIDATDELMPIDSLEAAEAWRVKWIGTKGALRLVGARTADGRDVYHAALRAWNDKLDIVRAAVACA